jgi:hypothetical protein
MDVEAVFHLRNFFVLRVETTSLIGAKNFLVLSSKVMS